MGVSKRPVLVDEEIHAHAADRAAQPDERVAQMERRERPVAQRGDRNAQDERHGGDRQELRQLLAHVAFRAERPVAVPKIVVHSAGDEADRERELDVEPEVQEYVEDDEADHGTRGADHAELQELADAAAHERRRGSAHASQYQSANSTVNSPSSGSESATIAELTRGLRPHNAMSMNAGKMTSTKRGMLMRLAVDIGTSSDAAKYQEYDGRSVRNAITMRTRNAKVKASSIMWLTDSLEASGCAAIARTVLTMLTHGGARWRCQLSWILRKYSGSPTRA